MAATTTIRVTQETRDLLARQAGERSISVSALLSEIAREGAFRSEREATRRDSEASGVTAEKREWDAAAGDGIG